MFRNHGNQHKFYQGLHDFRERVKIIFVDLAQLITQSLKMASYLNVPLESVAASTWQSFKLNKLKDAEGKQVQWLVFKFDSPKEPKNVLLDAQGSGSFADFVGALPETEARYGIYNLNYKKGDGDRQKVALLVWAPSAAHVKQRMLIASNKDAMKQQLQGIHIEFQAEHHSGLDFKEWIEQAQNTLK